MSTEQTAPTGGLSDADIFRSAMTPDAPAAPAAAPETPPPAAPPSSQPTDGQPRDPATGRWTAGPEKAPDAPAAAIQQQPTPTAQPAGQPPPAEGDHDIPSWRAREMRLEKDQAIERARQLEAAYLDQQRQFNALREQIMRAQQPAQPEQPPDVIIDPNGYHQHVQQTMESRLRTMEQNFSFRMAHERHGEQFEQAYTQMIGLADRGDRSVVQHVMRSNDPGAVMMQWWQQAQTLQMVNGDPLKWFDGHLDQRIANDPQFKAALIQKLQGTVAAAQAQQGGGGPVQLPPSLNRMAATAPAAVNGDMSDPSLFDFAFRQGRTPR